ncbi:hypothetical protein GQE99_12470 [Maritimibacter sp. DP07]|uniref:Uncharacterized protein n=1 Tax=Maritimibacter harenae TaxID=2606218 RepID=A0A845M5U9_9RHOB|nr:hypothetical protein [Maritimibacter harenae]MZR13828.1 hypothetical protein [Maritimibacter harenae]
MSLIMGRCLGVIVVYDPLRASSAVARFKDFIANSFSDHCIRVVTNHPGIKGDIVGSNDCAEFSGWEEGICDEDYEEYDIFICANDTFNTRRAFGEEEERRFLEELVKARSHTRSYLIGDLHWHINHNFIMRREKCVLKWVRTHIFAISTEAAKKTSGVALSKSEIVSMVNVDGDGNFVLSKDIPEVVRRRVEDWLRPADPSLGWHGSQRASRSHLTLKAMCVLQELDLTRRCVEAGVRIYSTARVGRREFLLSMVYNFEHRVL